jgi:hypothetical protein
LPIGNADDRGRSWVTALGFLPRLRLPSPDDLSPETAAYIENRKGPASARYLYLDLAEGELAELGTQSLIGAIVLLDRQDGGESRLSPVTSGEVLRHVIWQNFARDHRSEDILQRLQTVVVGSPCFQLQYGHASEAVNLLQETFGNCDSLSARNNEGGVTAPRQSTADLGSLLPAGTLSRRPGIGETTVDDDHFITDADGRAIHHLNPVAASVWRLLAAPMTVRALGELLQMAFSDVPGSKIDDDLRDLIARFEKKGLILRG